MLPWSGEVGGFVDEDVLADAVGVVGTGDLDDGRVMDVEGCSTCWCKGGFITLGV